MRYVKPLEGATLQNEIQRPPAVAPSSVDEPPMSQAEILAALRKRPTQTRSEPPAFRYRKDGVTELAYAGFWMRVAAYLIDSLIISAVNTVAFLLLFVIAIADAPAAGDTSPAFSSAIYLVLLASFIFSWLYFTIPESGSRQATIGKRALGLIVTDEEGRRIGFGKANGRYFGKFLSALILYIGFIMVAFTGRKQGLHDLLAGTLVLRRH
jgi:uncharacterized RDD family membrane protein YckC